MRAYIVTNSGPYTKEVDPSCKRVTSANLPANPSLVWWRSVASTWTATSCSCTAKMNGDSKHATLRQRQLQTWCGEDEVLLTSELNMGSSIHGPGQCRLCPRHQVPSQLLRDTLLATPPPDIHLEGLVWPRSAHPWWCGCHGRHHQTPCHRRKKVNPMMTWSMSPEVATATEHLK
jgi:hypothetical protein